MTAPPPEGWSLAEAAAAWFPDLWGLAADTTFCDAPAAREAWMARCRADPGHPVGRILAALPHEVASDTLEWLDARRAYPRLRPPPLAAETLRALIRADDALSLEWAERVRRADAAREALATGFCDRMARGEAIARGLAAARPSAGEVPIAASAWRAALPVFGYESDVVPGFPDLPAGTVVFGIGASAERFLAVRVFAAAAEAEAPARPGIEAARQWMARHVAADRQGWKLATAVAACQRATGCTRAEARRAWAELPAELREPPR